MLRTVVNTYNVKSIMKGERGVGSGVKKLSKKLYVIVEQPLRVVSPFFQFQNIIYTVYQIKFIAIAIR